MSDGPSIRNRRITNADFRLCSTYRSRSQAPLYVYALCPIANRAEGTFALLRYALGGDRPSQTAQLALSPARIHGSELELKYCQGGISPVTPAELALHLPRLPPMLHRQYLSPRLTYSKGSRGLSVLPRVRRIFTSTAVSPSSSLRQCSSRYAIHAGRNLPDKELRYLRTVIVTAAVYRGFGYELRTGYPALTLPLNLPTPSTRHTVYIRLRVSTVLCF